jgi:urease accessory protein
MSKHRTSLICLTAAGVSLAYAAPVFAHAGHSENSFVTGFLHPIYGLDHLLAMIVIGFLSARMEPKYMWTLPAAFVGMMAAGGLLGTVWGGDGVAAFEWGIMLSVLIFGLAAAVAPKIPLAAGNGLVAIFAICHGHAHVAEMGDASAYGYFPGMLVATGLLHLAGLLVGIGLKRGVGEWAVRASGALVAVTFTVILVANHASDSNPPAADHPLPAGADHVVVD